MHLDAPMINQPSADSSQHSGSLNWDASEFNKLMVQVSDSVAPPRDQLSEYLVNKLCVEADGANREEELLFNLVQSQFLRALDDTTEDFEFEDLDEPYQDKSYHTKWWMSYGKFKAGLEEFYAAEDEDPRLWPHFMVYAQFLALAKRQGFFGAMSDHYSSLFAPRTSVW